MFLDESMLYESESVERRNCFRLLGYVGCMDECVFVAVVALQCFLYSGVAIVSRFQMMRRTSPLLFALFHPDRYQSLNQVDKYVDELGEAQDVEQILYPLFLQAYGQQHTLDYIPRVQLPRQLGRT